MSCSTCVPPPWLSPPSQVRSEFVSVRHKISCMPPPSLSPPSQVRSESVSIRHKISRVPPPWFSPPSEVRSESVSVRHKISCVPLPGFSTLTGEIRVCIRRKISLTGNAKSRLSLRQNVNLRLAQG